MFVVVALLQNKTNQTYHNTQHTHMEPLELREEAVSDDAIELTSDLHLLPFSEYLV